MKRKYWLKAYANGRNKSQHCYVLLGVFGQQCCVRLHGPKVLTGFELYATSANKCLIVVVPCKRTQHVGLNNVACSWPTMLRAFAWALIYTRFSHQVDTTLPDLPLADYHVTLVDDDSSLVPPTDPPEVFPRPPSVKIIGPKDFDKSLHENVIN